MSEDLQKKDFEELVPFTMTGRSATLGMAVRVAHSSDGSVEIFVLGGRGESPQVSLIQSVSPSGFRIVVTNPPA